MGGPAPIPLTEIQAYLKLSDITDADEIDNFIHHIQVLDDRYLERMAKVNNGNDSK